MTDRSVDCFDCDAEQEELQFLLILLLRSRYCGCYYFLKTKKTKMIMQ